MTRLTNLGMQLNCPRRAVLNYTRWYPRRPNHTLPKFDWRLVPYLDSTIERIVATKLPYRARICRFQLDLRGFSELSVLQKTAKNQWK